MGWEWENSDRLNVLPVDLCRDKYIFDLDTPQKNINELVLQNQNTEFVTWKRTGDDRCFYVPVTIIDSFPRNSNLFRDVIACVSQMYRDNKYPENNEISSSLRQIADQIGIKYNGARAQEIEDILTFARLYTVKNQTLYSVKDGKTVQYSATFGFIESVKKEININGIMVNPRTAKTLIQLNGIYAQLLREKLPKAPVPVAALQIANQAPRRLITPTKNLIYRLAALVPPQKPPNIELSLSTLRNITGYTQTRKDKFMKSTENIFEIIYPIMISDYVFDSKNNKYIITLAGRRVGPNRTESGT